MNTPIKRKINVVDIVIMIAIVAAALAAGFGIFKGIGTTGDKVSIRYVIEVGSIDSEFTAKVNEGESVFDYADGQRIGTVNAVAASQAYHKGIDSQGAFISSPIEGKSTLHLTVTAEAVSTKTGYAVGNTVLGIGKDIELRFQNLYCQGKCVSIEVLEDDQG